ncbi:HemK family protein methyltransferase [Ramlibacter sp. 2FC]|uniref:HemK family protein methyltransferase n=1 Tax=Ramlibacter sp. 2FC TaxID=2502188 RepID=UPI0010F805C7|nr:HemK family protein methyltransferase [Ramlibacter sp. 2FC]
MTVLELIEEAARRLDAAGVAFGHGTGNAFDEAAWLVLWRLGLPLSSALEGEDGVGSRPVTPDQQTQVEALVTQRIATRRPAAYLTREAWLQGVPFYVDERAIVPRSFIAELLADGTIDPWLSEPSAVPGRPKQASAPSGGSEAHEVASVGAQSLRVLDLCTGNGSLAVLAAMAYPEVSVVGADISPDALAVARINVDKHQLGKRIALIESDGLQAVEGRFDLILCNPPYVNAESMAALPAEYQAEPALALAGGADGMDFVRALLRDAPARMNPQAVLVLEIGHERAHFEAAFPQLEVVWLSTSAGDDQVLLATREALATLPSQP